MSERWAAFKADPVFKVLWRYAADQRRYLCFAVLCSAGVALTSVSVLKPLQDVLNLGSSSGPHHSDTIKGIHTIVNASLLILLAYTIRWGFSYGQTVLYAEVSQRFTLKLRHDIYEHLQGLSLGYFNRQRTGALMSTINNDVPVLQSAIAGMKDVAPGPFLVVAGLIWAGCKSWQLLILAIMIMPIMSKTINLITKEIRRITAETQDKLSDVNVIMEETLSGIRIIQSFSAEKHEVARFIRETERAKDLSMESVRRQALLKPTIDVIGAAAVSLTVFVGGYLIVNGHLTIGRLVTFIAALNQVAVGINGIGSLKATWEQSQGAGRRIIDNILSVKSEITNAPDAVSLGEVEGRIEFDRVSFAYTEQTPVLRSVSFTMNPGEVVAVVGASGAGKSTLSDLIPRFYDPDGGSVTVDGHDVRAVTLESLRKHIGIVPQETVLFGGTIRDNIVYGDPNATDEMVEHAARAANAHDFIMDPRILPDGYQTIVGERGKQLSGGQRQRIAIARALLKDPRILILDEATSSLDAASEILVQEALDELMQGRTTLVIAHRLSTIINANKILVMQNGRIVEQGSHAELIKLPGGIYSQLYDTQFRWESEPKSNGDEIIDDLQQAACLTEVCAVDDHIDGAAIGTSGKRPDLDQNGAKHTPAEITSGLISVTGKESYADLEKG